jgi:hypothetical protein
MLPVFESLKSVLGYWTLFCSVTYLWLWLGWESFKIEDEFSKFRYTIIFLLIFILNHNWKTLDMLDNSFLPTCIGCPVHCCFKMFYLPTCMSFVLYIFLGLKACRCLIVSFELPLVTVSKSLVIFGSRWWFLAPSSSGSKGITTSSTMTAVHSAVLQVEEDALHL